VFVVTKLEAFRGLTAFLRVFLFGQVFFFFFFMLRVLVLCIHLLCLVAGKM
jgi:hypothetical protein